MRGVPNERARIAWWGLTAALGCFLLFVLYRFVGTVALAVFVYYGTRPVFRRVRSHVGSDRLAASATVFLLAVPILVFLAYLVAVGVGEIDTLLSEYRPLLEPYVNVNAFTAEPLATARSVLQDPTGGNVQSVLTTAVSTVQSGATALAHLLVALLIAFYLLREQRNVADWFRSEVSSEGSAGHAYAAAVDADLETVYFSTTLLVFVVAGLSLVVYHGYNLLAPAAASIPFPTALALLTGLASLIPLIVGKVVYLPLVGYLALSVVRSGEASLAYPLALLVVAFVLLDFVPLTFVLPALAGRSTHTALVLFSQIGGTMLFGWYGLFLGPIAVVLSIQLVRIVLSELIHGRRVTPRVTAAEGIGSDPPDGE